MRRLSFLLQTMAFDLRVIVVTVLDAAYQCEHRHELQAPTIRSFCSHTSSLDFAVLPSCHENEPFVDFIRLPPAVP